MKLIFTRNGSPLSKLIRWGLNEPVSHFGIVFDEGIVFHSNLLGSHIEWFKTFERKSEVVIALEYPLSLEEEEKIYRNILDTYDGSSYDFGALLYFAWRGFLNRVFKIQMPATNKWATSKGYLCTEIAGTLPEYILPSEITGQDLAIVSPYNLYNKIINRTKK